MGLQATVRRFNRTIAILGKEATPQTKNTLKTLENKLQQVNVRIKVVLPSNRSKRRLLDGLGTVVKAISGNMDAEDQKRLDNQLKNIENNKQIIKDSIDTQIIVNNNLFETIENITKFINTEQTEIENYFNKAQNLIYKEIEKENVELNMIEKNIRTNRNKQHK